jgi:hypothetical protein
MPRTIAVAVAAAALAASSGARSSPPAVPASSPLERQWVDNAARFVEALEAQLVRSAAGGSNLPSARKALDNVSDMYTMLIAYTYFDDCSRSLSNVGVPSRRLAGVVRTLTSACGRLQHASALFGKAVTGENAGLLLEATRLSLATEPLLYRARIALDAFSGPPGK